MHGKYSVYLSHVKAQKRLGIKNRNLKTFQIKNKTLCEPIFVIQLIANRVRNQRNHHHIYQLSSQTTSFPENTWAAQGVATPLHFVRRQASYNDSLAFATRSIYTRVNSVLRSGTPARRVQHYRRPYVPNGHVTR